MKHLKIICAALLLFSSAAFSQEVISISEPEAVGIEEDGVVLVKFLQGLITTNFQKYSGMTVIDEQNINTIKERQKRAESGDYSDEGADLRGQLSNANLTVTGTILKKAADFSLTFNVSDVRTGETRASSSLPQCSEEEIYSGKAANKISYELMTGFGVSLDAEAKAALTGTFSEEMTIEVESQMNRAKGIAAEKSGKTFEAMRYYLQAQKDDSLNPEISNRVVNIAVVISNSGYDESEDPFEQKRKWDALLSDAASLLAKKQIQLTLVSYPYIDDSQDLMNDDDWNNEKYALAISTPTLEQIVESGNEKMVKELLDALHKIPYSQKWGDKINGFPWSYADDFGEDNWLKKAVDGASYDFYFTVQLINEDSGAVIAEKDIGYRVKYDKSFSPALILPLGNLEEKIVFHGISKEDYKTTTRKRLNVIAKDGTEVSVMPSSLYEKKTARLKAIQNEQRKAQAEEKRKKEKAELKAANAVFYRGNSKSLYFEGAMNFDTGKDSTEPVGEVYSLVGLFEVLKWFSVGADLSIAIGHPSKIAADWSWEDSRVVAFEKGSSDTFTTYFANARFDFGYPVWCLYPHAFVGIGGYSAHLDGNSQGGLSFEAGIGLDACIRNHFVIGFLMKENLFLNLCDVKTFGINLGWRF